MENIKNVKRSARAKQTSTPLNLDTGAVFLKTLSNVSSIGNKYRKTKHFVIESPSIFDWESSLECSRSTSNSKYASFEETSKERPDTPLKPQKRVRFSSTSFVYPVKLKFSEISISSNVNSKLSDVMKRCSGSVNKHLLHVDEKRENNIAERDCLKRIEKFGNEKEICNLKVAQHPDANLKEKDNANRKKSIKTYFTSDRNQVTQNTEIEMIAQELSNISNTILKDNICIEIPNFDFNKSKSTMKETERKRSIDNDDLKHQDKLIKIFNNLVSEKEPFNVKEHGETMCPSTLITKTSQDYNRADLNKRKAEKTKKSFVKIKRNYRKRHAAKNKDGCLQISPNEELFLKSNNVQYIPSIEKEDKVEIFKKPFAVSEKISKRTISEKGGKRKTNPLFPPTSTPFDSPATAKEKLPMIFESLSPVRSTQKESHNPFPDDFPVYGIKVKRTYSKAFNFNSKSDKENARWESFLEKPSHQVKNNNYVSEISISKNSDSIYLFESPPHRIIEGASVDAWISSSSLKRNTGSKRTSRRYKTESSVIPSSSFKRFKSSKRINTRNTAGNSVERDKRKTKKWFETTKLKELAAHFNEISNTTSLIIEKVSKK